VWRGHLRDCTWIIDFVSTTTIQTLHFAGGRLPFCVRHLFTSQQRHCRPCYQLIRKTFSVFSNNAIRFPISLKVCGLCKFKMWWIIYGHPVFHHAPLFPTSFCQ
jgi:hypothetical protein